MQHPDHAGRRDLLYGVIALQMGFVSQEQFVEVLTLLPSQEQRSAEDLFRTKGYLKPTQDLALRALIDAKLEQHDGDVGKSIADFAGSTAVDRSLVLVGALPSGESAVPDGATLSFQRSAPPPAERYATGRELGRGGLGRVVLAIDHDLMDREVAMKLLLDEATKPGGGKGRPARERFLDEAQITAHLQHPNIVAVYELGQRPDGSIYYTMPVIGGRSLHQEIVAAHGRLARREIAPEAWGVERLRLIAAFQAVCHGLSYAHARGVVHRDIKPANIMMGAHGETLLLDWGLAKVVRVAGSPGSGPDASSDQELQSQLDGLRERSGDQTVEGTVTGTPAYMSPEQAAGRIAEIDVRSDIYSLGAVLYELLTGRPPFVGHTAYEILLRAIAGVVDDPCAASLHAVVPEDLAAVCRKAMRKDKRERYQQVSELLADVTLSLEGSRERERNRQRCEERLQVARELLREYEELSRRIAALRDATETSRKAIKPWESRDAEGSAKVVLLDREQEVDEAVRGSRRLFNAVLTTLGEGLAFEPAHRETRRELAELHYRHFLLAEQEQNAKEMEFHQAQVAAYGDGAFDARLEGDGSVELTSDPPGAETRLFRYVERRWILVPEEERALGTTPVARTTLSMGSYLLVLSKAGYRDTRVPFVVGRLEEVRLEVALHTDAGIGADFVYVPGGTFRMLDTPVFHELRDLGLVWRIREHRVDGFFISRFPVTFPEYCRWLDWLEANRPEEVAERLLQDPLNGPLVRKGADGRWAGFDPGTEESASRYDRMPAMCVTWHNAVAFAAWRSEQDGRSYALPTEAQWEKAARGADGRHYPWGNRFDATLCKNFDSEDARAQPAPVGQFETDESPYAMRDAGGGVSDWTGDWFDHREKFKVSKGGSWSDSANNCRVATRHGVMPKSASAKCGFRLVATAPLPRSSA